jgi:hypothetical protein
MTTNSTPALEAHHAPMTDRRAFLAAAPALAVLTAGPALAAIPAGDPGFEECLRTYREACRQQQIYDETVYYPVRDHYVARREAFPHSVTKRFLPGRTEGLSTADESVVRMARSLAEGKVFEGGPDNASQELLRLADQRDAQIDALKHETGFHAAAEHAGKLLDNAGAALTAVEEYPVRSLGDLIRKLEVSEQEGFDEVSFDVLLADLRRIREQPS